MIIADITRHLDYTPFQPFTLRIADGHEYPVPTIDHIYLPPGGKQVIIADDEGVTVAIPALLITGFVRESPESQPQPTQPEG